jgi:hypothetical protein
MMVDFFEQVGGDSEREVDQMIQEDHDAEVILFLHVFPEKPSNFIHLELQPRRHA